MIMLVILTMGGTALLLNSLNNATPQLARARVTADALAQAKEALIGYATSVALTGSNRPGDLPCPDMNNDGVTDSPCGNAAGTTGQSLRLGRLPWKTLGLPDLRDGSGERLWYAVSNNFKEHWNTATPLNSDTMGTISVFSPEGVLINDGGGSTGAVAVIIAPGDVLTRQDATSPQNRSCTLGVNCDVQEKCTTTPATLTPKCDPKNYLDIPTAGVNLKDNDKFADGSSTDGFIQGRIQDANEQILLNDQILVITQDNMMQAIQKLVAGAVGDCLDQYASINNGRYPWAAPLNDFTYFDQSNLLFGRIPDDMSRSRTDSVSMTNQWPLDCSTHTAFTANSWWTQWRELVFYGLADAYKPINPPSTASTCTPPGACLSVNPPSPDSTKKYVVIVAGKMTGTQVRTSVSDKSNLNNYLEAPNNGGATTFSKIAPSATFNDNVIYQQ